MSLPIESLPLWALETMIACARGAGRTDWVSELEAVSQTRLFEEVGEQTWLERFPIMARVKARELPPQALWEAIPVEVMSAILGDNGELAQRLPGYEVRAGQIRMAEAVAQALNGGKILLAEAGTGVGKSLAYLVPTALWACANRLPVVISTSTRNLQTQLLTKDVPLVREVIRRFLPPDVRLRAVVLKGRRNYLCLKQFGAYLEGGFEKLNENEALLFADLVAWAAETRDGDLDTFRPSHARGDGGFVRSFGCGADLCTGKKCRFYQRCFLQRARAAAQQAHLIIANHALVFSDLTNPGTLLPDHAQIVFDEAHNVENAATDFLSAELSPMALYELCQKLAPSRGREAGSVLQQTQTAFLDKASLNDADRLQVLDLLAQIRTCGITLAKVGTELFETLYEAFKVTPESHLRYRSVPAPGGDPSAPLQREVSFQGRDFQSAAKILDEAEIAARRAAVLRALGEGTRLLERLQNRISAMPEAQKEDNPYEDLLLLVELTKSGLEEFGNVLAAILEGSDPGMVYWMTKLDAKEHAVALTAAPLEIATPLRKILYEAKHTVVFSSATLRVGDDFAYLRKRLGLNFPDIAERVEPFVAESPFDYPAQCCLAVPTFLPDIVDEEAYCLEFSRLMYRLFVTSQGRALALFTSYAMMCACADLLRPHLEAKGICLLTQADAMGRDAMTETFRSPSKPTVLFGTQSFWEGVDIVGTALSCVVIARLPFETYGDPLFKARCEKIEQEGGSSFRELSVPQAVIRLRQGFGRLIRSRADKGVVVVADTRFVRKTYGKTFQKALPVEVETFATRPALERRLRGLLGGDA